ncbi:MAG: hypothetical protein OSB60_15480 [Myxococcota bacterium]|mgnify:CR=1 FL=1|nr:hypothetical protein [Myxococcota bacterium]
MTDRHAQHGAFYDDFKELEVGSWRVVVSDQFTDGFRLLADAVNFAQCSSAEALGKSDSKSVGRARNTIIQLPGHDVRFQLRPLCHGGVLAPITGKRFAGLDRPLQELRVTAGLRKRGAPVAVPAFVVGRRTGFFWEASYATVHIEDARDGAAFLDTGPNLNTLERTARAAGVAIRDFHELGGWHADLHIKNLLIGGSTPEPEVTIIDLDRARITDEISAGRRMQEIMRLRRSLIKRGYTNALSESVGRAFMDGYVGHDAELRSQLNARVRAERVRGRAHALFYRAP